MLDIPIVIEAVGVVEVEEVADVVKQGGHDHVGFGAGITRIGGGHETVAQNTFRRIGQALGPAHSQRRENRLD